MKTIWKYELPFTAAMEKLEMPVGAEVLTVHMHNDRACLWVRLDTEARREARYFSVIGTGHPVPDTPATYHGTAHLFGGSLVFHVFEHLKG